MNLYNRAIRIFLIIFSAVAGFVVTCAWYISRLILSPPRLPVALPLGSDMPVEQVQFPAVQDGLRIAGWLLPQARGEKAPAMIIVHGWPQNRLGEDRTDITGQILKAEKLDYMSLAQAFHQDGYAVLMFDLRNHGQSAGSAGGVTFGLSESLDLLGAIDYLGSRSDIDMERIGVTGFSMGGNTTLYALSRTDQIKAAAVIQPTTPKLFSHRLATYLTGPLGIPIIWVANMIVKLLGGTALEDIDIVQAASQAGKTPVLYIQGAGDQYGSLADVEAMAAATPNLVDLVVAADAENRYQGYTYALHNPEILRSYFQEHLNL